MVERDAIVQVMVIVGAVLGIGGLTAVLVLIHKMGILGSGRVHEGQKGTAKVMLVEPLETREANNMTVLKLVLEVKPHGHAAYEIRTKRKVPTSQAATVFEVGQTFDVLIVGKDESQIAIVGFDPVPNAYAGAKYGS